MRYIKSKRSRALLLSTVFCITYLLSFMTYIEPLTAFAASTGTVTDSDVNVRTGPSTSYSIITKLHTGAQVTILDTVDGSDTYSWHHIGFIYNGNYTEGYIASLYVSINTEYSEDADFEAYLNAQGFPDSYKDGLRNLHARYPKWVFLADHVSYNWDTVVDAQNKTGRSLIYGSAVSSWKSLEENAYNWETGVWYEYDSGGWVAASRSLISYALDPRNFFNETNIFMFESLRFNAALQSESGVSAIVSNSFMNSINNIGDGTGLEFAGIEYSSYAKALMFAGQWSGVSPYHLATRIIQEVGSSGQSNSISGTVSGYQGYYNYYNQGAYATSDGTSAIINGLKFAKENDDEEDAKNLKPWNSRMRSIIGGAIKLGSSYINKGQYTLYYQKFDLVSPFWHQYMTNILAPRSESSIAAKAYSESVRISTGLVFTIPVYQNMPSSACAIPTGNGSPNNALRSLSVSNASLTPTFNYKTTNYDVIVSNSVASINVSSEAMVSSASISGNQSFGLNVGNNTINVVVTAQNGDARTYTLNVVRQAPPTTPDPPTDPPTDPGNENETGTLSPNSYTISGTNNTISGVSVGSSTSDVLNGITVTGSYTKRIVNADGSDNNGLIGTGSRLVVTNGVGNTVYDYTFVVYGDVTGDGVINAMDLLNVKRHILGARTLEGKFALAGDANRGNDSINAMDLLYIKRALLGVKDIIQ